MRLVWIQKNKNPHRGESSIKESYVMSYVRKVILNKTPYSVLLPERLATGYLQLCTFGPRSNGCLQSVVRYQSHCSAVPERVAPSVDSE